MIFVLIGCLILAQFALADSITICLPKKEVNIKSQTLLKRIYEPLVIFDKTKKVYLGNLIKSIKLESEKTLVIEVKKEIAFHSNRVFKSKKALSSKDIKFTFMRLKERSKIKFFNDIESINNIDDYTVKIKSKSKLRDVYKNLSLLDSSILSIEYFNKLKKMKQHNLFEELPIGTGPYKASGIRKDSITLSLFKKHWSRSKKTFKKINYTIKGGALECDINQTPQK